MSDDYMLFNFLEGLTNDLERGGCRDLASELRCGYARGTGGVDVPWLHNRIAELILAARTQATKERSS